MQCILIHSIHHHTSLGTDLQVIWTNERTKGAVEVLGRDAGRLGEFAGQPTDCSPLQQQTNKGRITSALTHPTRRLGFIGTIGFKSNVCVGDIDTPPSTRVPTTTAEGANVVSLISVLKLDRLTRSPYAVREFCRVNRTKPSGSFRTDSLADEYQS